MIVLGRLTAPYGVQGWLRLHPFGDDPERWREMRAWWLGRDENDFSAWRSLPLRAMRLQGRSWVVKFTGVDDRSAAEALTGSFVGSPREALPTTDANEYYWADLVGLLVVNERDEVLGRVVEMVEAGAHAVMVVREGEGKDAVERMLPFVGAVVRDVEMAAGRVRVAWERDW